MTFLWLEITSIVEDIADIGMLFNGQIVEFVVGFVVDSFQNTLAALMWPVDIVTWNTPWGAIVMALAFWLFPTYAKPHIEKWLFDQNPEK